MTYRTPVTGHDEPIEPTSKDATPYAYSNVLNFESLSIKHGRGKRFGKPCEHNHLVYDPGEKRVWCEDCESTVDSFDAFLRIVRDWESVESQLRSRALKLLEDEKQNLISRAAKAVDRAFRKQKTAPTCPHCKEALLPEDMLKCDHGGINKDWVRRMRKKRTEGLL